MKVISGCQTGADEAGLQAAYDLGIPTGGTMPKGWKTQTGPRPDWGEKYGLMEHGSSKYPPRTRKNVKDADVTILFGDMASSGCTLTIRYCRQNNKPYFTVPFYGHKVNVKEVANDVLEFLREHKPRVINIAGNRENSNKGVAKFTHAVLSVALKDFRQDYYDIVSFLFED